MHFPIIELDKTRYLLAIKQLLEDADCHIFVDTNILSQLFKLNSSARQDFYNWVDNCGARFHIPNWVVLEYSKRVYGNMLADYVDELSEAKKITQKLEMLQKFFCGYVDEAELRGTVYQDNKTGLLDDMKDINDKYSKISVAVINKKTEHIKKVQKEIDERLKSKTMNTDIYSIISNLYFDYQLRFDSKIPPGYQDKDKTTNYLGDLIIWNEILQYCKANHLSKIIFITRDSKPDMYYVPEIQSLSGRLTNEKIHVAHESLKYEFKLNSGGSDECYLINFYSLVNLLSDKFRDLAFSFQLVSRDGILSEDKTDRGSAEAIEDMCEHESAVPSEVVAVGGTETIDGYSQEALNDANYVDSCLDNKLRLCIEHLKSHNWYTQNDAIDEFYLLINKNTWEESQQNKDAFFVIGRNILQSAEGNAFEACRFIERMGEKLPDKPKFMKCAIVDGCLYEVFFNHNNELRQDGFKSRYFKELVREAKKLGIENPFEFINSALSNKEGKFTPLVGENKDYTFKFTFKKPENGIDWPHTLSLEIDGKDVSDTFTYPLERRFSEKDELKEKLSQRYAVPIENVKVDMLPDDIEYIYFIKKTEAEDGLDSVFAATK